MNGAQFYDAVIVGLGPTGATLANLLGRCGLRVLVLERETAIYPLPRAVHFDDEVMRVLQCLGVAGEVAETIRVNPGMRFVDPDGRLLLDWPRPQEVGPNGWHASYRFHQPDLERILRDALAQRSSVEARTGAAVVGIEEGGDLARVHYQELSTDQFHVVEAKYVVGCDGARSLVREAMGTALEDLGFHERWLVVDLLLKRPKPELGDHTLQFCDPARPVTYCRNPGARRRWEIALHDHEDAEEMAAPGSVWNFLGRWLSPDDAEIERKAVYTFRSAIARRWRAGRCLLAGDAAHLTPPFMGQGLCAGIRDAANLAWKLALCASGAADDRLLDSYESERAPHARQYIETAMRLGGLVNTLGSEEALRAALPQADGSARMESIAPRLGAGLTAGSDRHRGRLFPQLRLADGRLMDEAVGYAPLLVAERALLEPSAGLLPDVRVLSTDAEPSVGPCLASLECKAVVVRPDRYVLGTAATTEELRSLLAIARDWCGPGSPLR